MSRTRNIGSGRIIEAARDVITNGGPEALTISAVAREAGVTKGTVYYYFNAKEDLVNAVIRSSVDAHIAQFDAAFEGADGERERIENTLDAVRDVFLKDGEFHRMFFSLIAKGLADEESAGEIRQILDKIGDTIEKRLSEVARDGSIVPPDHLGRILRAIFDGLALQALFDPDLDVDAVFESLKEIVMALYTRPAPAA